MKNKNQILFITNFSSINSTYNTHELLIKHLAKKFNKLIFVNAEKLLSREKKILLLINFLKDQIKLFLRILILRDLVN